MVWDVRGALLKKEERESARLADFEFKHRARTFRLMAESLAIDPAATVALIAHYRDKSVLQEIARRHLLGTSDLRQLYESCRVEARAQIMQEEGDPSPYPLA